MVRQQRKIMTNPSYYFRAVLEWFGSSMIGFCNHIPMLIKY